MIRDRLLSVNYTPGRGSMLPDMIVIHVTEGSAASVRSWFAAPAAEVSAHYMVCRDGSIDRFVKDEDTAWHAGRVYQPTAPLVKARPGINPNQYSIGVEHEGTGKTAMTSAQRTASLGLLAELCERWSISPERKQIVGHHEVYAKKSCPGAINVDALVAELRIRMHPTAIPPRPPVVWSHYAHDWLVVTRIGSDTDWEFVPMKTVMRAVPTKASVPLSSMPLTAL